MSRAIDLNGDVGEYADPAARAEEEALLPLLTSCSIACGGHAGDERSMRATARLARRHGVAAGAHPSYPDPEGFGRRRIRIDDAELRRALEGQLRDLRRVLDREGIPLRHVKPHGALYHDAGASPARARLVIETAVAVAGPVTVIGPPGSSLEACALAAGLGFAAEGFVDRRYRADGSLVPRGEAGDVIERVEDRAAQAVALARAEGPRAVRTLCIHGDSPGAVPTARAVRGALEAAGIPIRALA